MQAYYEIEAQIPLNHHLSLQLPDSIPVGIAKIAVVYDLPEKTEHKSTAMAAFLQNLPELAEGEELSRTAINEHLQQERQNWD